MASTPRGVSAGSLSRSMTQVGVSRMRVVLIHHSSNIPPPSYRGDLSEFKRLLELSPGVQCSEEAWDDPCVDWKSFTHFLITSLVDYVPQFEDFSRWLDRLDSSVDGLAARMFNPPAVVRWNSSKKYLKELEVKGVRVPPTIWLEAEQDLRAWDSGSPVALSGEVVVKNVVDASGVSAWRCRLERGRFSPSDARRLWDQLAASHARDGVLVQAFLETVLLEGEWSLVYFDGRLSHGVLKTPKQESDFRVQSRYGGRFVPVRRDDLPAGVVAFGDLVMASLPFADAVLFARVDVVRSGDVPYLMEVEVLDPFLYLTEPEQSLDFFNAFMRAAGKSLPQPPSTP